MRSKFIKHILILFSFILVMACDDGGGGSSENPNPGPNTLSFTDANAGFPGLRMQPACCPADVDGDGDQDLFFAGHGVPQAVLYRNNGRGIFSPGPADEFAFF